MAAEFALAMAGAAAAHQAAAASREGNGKQTAGRARRSSGDPQRAQQGATAAAAAAPAALDSLSRLQQLANASPQVAQLRRLQALADARFAPVAQLAGGPEEEELVQGKFATAELADSPEEEELLQGKFGNAQLQPQLQLQQAPRANNTGLPDQLKSGIESLSGLSMDHVRVHYNSPQPAQLNALAYAQGSDIHLAPGQERHLPHEAWHVVQQAQGRVKPTLQMAGGLAVNDDAGLEREADVMGEELTTDKKTNGIVQQKGGEVENNNPFLQQLPIKPTTQLKDCVRAHIDNVPCSSVIQRVIEIDGKKYSLDHKEEFLKKHQDDLDAINRALMSADFQMGSRTIDGALADKRTIMMSKDLDSSPQETFYEVDCEEAFVKHKEGKSSRLAGEKPLYVTKPGAGIEEILIEGLIMCVGVIIEVTDEKDKIVGAAGGHFVTPTMLTEMGLMLKGYEFIEAIMQSVDSWKGKKRFSLHYSSDKDLRTKEALVVLEHTFVTQGYEKRGVFENGSKVSYSLDAKGDSKFK